MTDNHDRQGKSVSKNAGKASKGKSGGDDIGKALRSAYDRTVNEEVPTELLDLLGKLK